MYAAYEKRSPDVTLTMHFNLLLWTVPQITARISATQFPANLSLVSKPTCYTYVYWVITGNLLIPVTFKISEDIKQTITKTANLNLNNVLKLRV